MLEMQSKLVIFIWDRFLNHLDYIYMLHVVDIVELFIDANLSGCTSTFSGLAQQKGTQKLPEGHSHILNEL